MRSTRGQLAVYLLCGEQPPMEVDRSMKERIALGRNMLVSLTGCDFGYDLKSWHEYLRETGDGGYTWRSKLVFPKIMQEALESPEWNEAVAGLTARGGDPWV